MHFTNIRIAVNVIIFVAIIQSTRKRTGKKIELFFCKLYRSVQILYKKVDNRIRISSNCIELSFNMVHLSTL